MTKPSTSAAKHKALSAAREAVVEDIEAALAQRRELENQLKELVELAERLTAQLGDDDTPGVVSRAGETRVDAVHRVLSQAGQPISPERVDQSLRAEGRVETRKDIHSALSYLAAKGRSERVGDALWKSLG